MRFLRSFRTTHIGHSLKLLLLVFVVTATGCGTRVVTRPDATGATGTPGGAPQGALAAAEDRGGRPLTVQAGPDGPGSRPDGTGGAGPTPARPGPAPARSTGPTVVSAGGTAAAEGPAEPGAPAAGSAASTRSGPGTPTPVPPPAPAPNQAGKRSVLKLGSVGTLSGPVGATLKGTVEALQVWQRMVNDRGGLNGHPVRISFVDDGGDPARHLAAKKDLLEREKVVAFVQDNTPLGSGRSSQSYLQERRVPVIGSETGSQWFYDSPMYFPQAPSGTLAFFGGVFSHGRAVAMGHKRLGILACVESTICDDHARVYSDHGPDVGFEVVYRGRGSLTQPDFTAECLAARNANVEVFTMSLDPSSVNRLAAACARQGYHPIYALLMSMITDDQRKDPNLAGALGVSNVFPWFEADTPATAEFRAAMERYLPGTPLGIAHATGWVTGKLLEKAAANLAEPPTSDAILRGLWAMHDETLGGLTRVTFTEGRPAKRIACWFDLAISDSRWVTPDGFAQHCAEPPARL
ncbi:MAG TPA: ABC transporter substrate-binding protein [Acidimicrobiia bacterium]|nr:ABC transporter substrate-binding protein [Acidimicrobiia bacterium]